MTKEYLLKTPSKEYVMEAEVTQSLQGIHLSLSIKEINKDDVNICLNTFLVSPDIISSALEDAIPKKPGLYELMVGNISIIHSSYTPVMKALGYQIHLAVQRNMPKSVAL